MLDTNVAGHIIRGPSPAVRDHLLRAPDVCISVVTEAEILFGLAKKPGAVGLRKGAEMFLAHIEVLSWTRATARAHGPLRARLEASGKPLGAIDTLIAAHALAEDATLVTADRAFDRVPGLSLEDWLAA